MKQLILFLIAVISAVPANIANPLILTQNKRDTISTYFMESYPKQIVIRKKSGEIISVIDIPLNVAVSVHTISGSVTQRGGEGLPYIIEGNISVMARPQSEIIPGSVYDQMMQSSFKLDLYNAIVEVKIMK